MPDAVLGPLAGVRPFGLDSSGRFDLVVLAYPVWFLSPATPVQAFFRSPDAGVLRDTDVLTISVSRAMWQRASMAMKRLLAAAGARHCDNVAVTHQGSPLATLISTPRALLSGKRDRLLGVFPNAGIAEKDMSRVQALASVAARRLMAGHRAGASLLRGEPAVSVTRWLAVPERLGWYCFYAAARVIRFFGTVHRGFRTAGVVAFAVFLVLLILIALPVAVLATVLATPILRQAAGRIHRAAGGTNRRMARRVGYPRGRGERSGWFFVRMPRRDNANNCVATIQVYVQGNRPTETGKSVTSFSSADEEILLPR